MKPDLNSTLKSELLYGNIQTLENAYITIGIPSYGRIDTLKEAINSILNQNRNVYPIAILISEDHSEFHEEIKQAIMQYSDEVIVYFYNPKALGLVGNWNNLLRLARSDYVALLHDDDVLYPNYFEVVESCFHQLSNFDLIYFAHDTIHLNQKNDISIPLGFVKNLYKNMLKNRFRRLKPSDYYWGG